MSGNPFKNLNLVLIRCLAILLCLFAFCIAGLNYGLAEKMGHLWQERFHEAYMWFEHYFRGLTVCLGALLTYRFLKQQKKTIPPQRRMTLISFSISSFLFLIVWPLFSGYWELYEALMPFPWSTLPFQLAGKGTFFGRTLPGWRGIDGATLLLWAYGGYQIFVLGGTILLGRKWQCSMLCLLNGCHAESLGIALPLVRYNKRKPFSKRLPARLRRFLRILGVGLFCINLVLISLWSLYLITGRELLPAGILVRIEGIKYTTLELTLLMVLWFFIGGRGYCYYCPAGFALGLISRLAGQKIETGLTHCTDCGKCDAACKLSIDIRRKAVNGEPVRSIHCVGCGLCSDACPSGNLRYSTYFLKRFSFRVRKND